MTLEQATYREQPIPDWAERERWADLAWISDNLPAFHSAASIAYEVLGRGAVVVETTYHTIEEIEAAEAQDPLLANARLLIETGAARPERLSAMIAEIRARIDS